MNHEISFHLSIGELLIQNYEIADIKYEAVI